MTQIVFSCSPITDQTKIDFLLTNWPIHYLYPPTILLKTGSGAATVAAAVTQLSQVCASP